MQDIDFDEIDRAVSSTMGNNPAEVSRSDDTAERSTPSVSKPAVPPAARRSSGRFMDVVHPSSDMRPSARPDRSAPRPPEPITPTSEDRTNDWPDPLDFHGFKDEPAETPPSPVEKPGSEPAPQPLESPFLPDTKVEKRPLGGIPPEKPLESLLDDTELLLEAPDDPLLTANTPPEPETKPFETPSEDVMEKEEPMIPEAEEKTSDIPSSASEPSLSASEEVPSNIPTSITQQYKEQPSSTDQASGAIYDTEAYHQPLTHTPKKHSGVLVIIWIIALILVGAGAGAAIYFFVLPTL